MDKCSFHMHTNASDGVYSPEKLVSLCEGKLKAIAITDHDTTTGVLAAMKTARNIEVISGIECDCKYKGVGVEILGYFIDLKSEPVLKFIDHQKRGRAKAAREIVDSFNELFPKQKTSFEELTKYSTTMVGKAQLARVMVDKKIVPNIQEAFDKYLGKGGEIRSKTSFSMKARQVAKIIIDSRGFPSLAHPIIYEWKRHDDSPSTDALLGDLKISGLLGVEVFHPEHNNEDVARFMKLADKNGLVMTGGSDFHGHGEDSWDKKVDDYTVPYSILENMKKKHADFFKS